MPRRRITESPETIREQLLRMLTDAEKSLLLSRRSPITVETIADFIHEDALRVLRGERPMETTAAPHHESQLLGLLLCNPERLMPRWNAQGDASAITNESVRRVLGIASEMFARSGQMHVADLFEAMGRQGMKSAQAGVARLLASPDSGDIDRFYDELIKKIEIAKRRRCQVG